MSFKKCHDKLMKLENKVIAEHSLRFFKTAPGEYGYGDKFLGIRVPEIRKLSREFQHLSLKDVQKLLDSKWHEERMLGLFIVVLKYQKDPSESLYKFYLKNIKAINNWDLVDTTAHKIVGKHLLNRNKDLLFKWVKDKNLWKRRIAVLSTYTFIKAGNFKPTIKLVSQLLEDKEDLMHKVCGWMLREIAKLDKGIIDSFLKKYMKKMPRTMLRYTIEQFPESERKEILVRSK